MGDKALLEEFQARLAVYNASAVLEEILKHSAKYNVAVYLVGGNVRDLLLSHSSPDVDIVVEGDAAELARSVAADISARLTVHQRFGTAHLHLDGLDLDIATARAEEYPHPGSLPVVRPAALSDDLARRDFSINSMALALSAPDKGRLIDPYGGRRDMEAGLIRVLHDRSFIDDATRILRAVRYESRLGFSIETHTLDLLQRNKHYLTTVNAPRLRLEFHRTLLEERPEIALSRLQALDVLLYVHPELRFDMAMATAFARARELAHNAVPVYLALLALPLTVEQARSLAARLAISKAQRRVIEESPRALTTVRSWPPGVAPSRVAADLEGFSEATLWGVAVGAEEQERDLVRRYFGEWRQVRPDLDGRDLQALGAPTGPKLGEILAALKAGRLDGRLRTREDEVRLAAEMINNWRGDEIARPP